MNCTGCLKYNFKKRGLVSRSKRAPGKSDFAALINAKTSSSINNSSGMLVYFFLLIMKYAILYLMPQYYIENIMHNR